MLLLRNWRMSYAQEALPERLCWHLPGRAINHAQDFYAHKRCGLALVWPYCRRPRDPDWLNFQGGEEGGWNPDENLTGLKWSRVPRWCPGMMQPLASRGSVQSGHFSPPGTKRNKDSETYPVGNPVPFTIIRKIHHWDPPNAFRFNSYMFLNSESWCLFFFFF